jgi:hypothetical protein
MACHGEYMGISWNIAVYGKLNGRWMINLNQECPNFPGKV